MTIAALLPSPTLELHDPRLVERGIRLWLKRDDLINPDIPGNKWRKLKYNLEAASGQPLVTFGGAYSNHIRAVAAAGQYLNLPTTGIIRGEEHQPLNSSLAKAAAFGMNFHYVDRQSYRDKRIPAEISGDYHLIPEGGSNALALPGCAELVAEIDIDYDIVCCAVGTGGTLAGIATGLPPGKRAIGYSALKGDFLTAEVRGLQRSYQGVTNNWTIETGYHHGGYAKRSPELDAFIRDFQHRHGLELDWVYVAKMLYGIYAGTFPAGTRIVAIITG